MWLDIAMICILIICLVTDIQNRKIYNYVLLPGFIASLMFHTFENGLAGFGHTLIGAVVGISILFIPFALGGMGAGDVKLLGIIGAWKGSMFVLYASLYMAIIGGIMALLIILLQSGWKHRLKGYAYFFALLKHGKFFKEFLPTQASKLTYPYGVAIVMGTFYLLVFGIQGGN